MPQIGRQLPGLLSTDKKMKEMCVIPKSAMIFHFAAVELWNYENVLRLWITGAVKPVGQLYGSSTALKSQYLVWDRYLSLIHI